MRADTLSWTLPGLSVKPGGGHTPLLRGCPSGCPSAGQGRKNATTKPASESKADSFRAGNQTAAEIIAADLAKYPPGTLPAIWAEVVLAKAAERTEPAIRGAAAASK